MIGASNSISITKQCELLSVKRSSYYYLPVELSESDFSVMERIDALYTEDPTRGTRRLKGALKKRYGIKIGRDKIRGYMALMGISAIYPKRRLSIPDKSHKKYPYLLNGVKITRVNQVWSTDITYIKLKHGFVYLTAVIDWYSRYVLSWRTSTTLDRQFCIDALDEAIQKYGTPEIFNTDQGTQYTSDEFIGKLKANGIKISMDGKGRALDNVFVERLWRTVKYEEVYLKGYRNIFECKVSLRAFFERYNNQREHSSLDYNYPSEIYFGKLQLKVAA